MQAVTRGGDVPADEWPNAGGAQVEPVSTSGKDVADGLRLNQHWQVEGRICSASEALAPAQELIRLEEPVYATYICTSAVEQRDCWPSQWLQKHSPS